MTTRTGARSKEQREPTREGRLGLWARGGLVVCGGVAVPLGIAGFMVKGCLKLEAAPGAVLQTLQLFVLNVPVDELTNGLLWGAAFFAPLATAGALATALSEVLTQARRSRRVLRLRNEPAWDLFLGGGDTAAAIAARRVKGLPEGRRLVGLDPAKETALSRTLRALGDENFVLEGDALTRTALHEANTVRADRVWITSGDDYRNLEIARLVLQLRSEAALEEGIERQVLVNLVDQHLSRARQAVFGVPNDKVKRQELQFFSMPRLAARTLLAKHPPAVDADFTRVHIGIVGTGRLAAALAVHAAQHCVYSEKPEDCVRISLIGTGANELRERLRRQCPVLDESLDATPALKVLLPVARIRAHECDEVELAPSTWGELQSEVRFSVIYVCTERDLRAVVATLRIAALRDTTGWPVPVVTCLQQPGVDSVLSGAVSPDLDGVHSFDVFERCIQPEENYPGARGDARAQIVHDAFSSEELDPELEPTPQQRERAEEQWETLEEEFRWSSRMAADHIDIKLQILGIANRLPIEKRADLANERLRDSETLLRMMRLEHRRFVVERLLDGWLPVSSHLTADRAPSKLNLDKQKSLLRLNQTLVPFEELDQLDEPNTPDRKRQRNKDRKITLAIPRVLRACPKLVLAVAGRRIDAFDAEVARFPRSRVELVRELVAEQLTAERVSAVVCSAACGADLIVLEAALELDLECQVVLPSSKHEFVARSVTDRGEEWGPIFSRVMNQMKERGHRVLEDPGESYARTNTRILDEASAIARRMGELEGTSPVLAALLVWDGKERGGEDLTASLGQEARSRGFKILEVKTL